MTADDIIIALLIGYVAASAVTPLPELSNLLRHSPRLARWAFIAGLGAVMAIHLDLP